MKKLIAIVSLCVGLQGTSLFGATMITQGDLPFVIGTPGDYEFAEDLTLFAGIADPAITIEPGASPVVLLFKGRKLTLENTAGAQTGILVANANNVMIDNSGGPSEIVATSQAFQSTGIKISDSSSALSISHLQFTNLSCGITGGMTEADQTGVFNFGLMINDCTFNMIGHPTAQGIAFGALDLSNISGCVFTGGVIGINLFNNVCDNTMATNSFTDTACGISIQSVDDEAHGFYFGKQSARNVIEGGTTFTNVERAVSVLGAINTQVSDTAIGTSPASKVAMVAATPTRDGIPLLAGGLKGADLTLTDVNFTATGSTQAAHLALGGLEPNSHFDTVSITRGEYTNEFATKLFWDIVAPQVSNLSIDSTVHTASAVARDMDWCPYVTGKGCPLVSSHIQLGLPLKGLFAPKPFVSDVSITDPTMMGGMQAGIRSDTGCFPVKNCNIAVTGGYIMALERGAEFINTKKSMVQGATITGATGTTDNTGVGVYIRKCTPCNKQAASTDIVIENNTITMNDVGVVVDCGLPCNKVINNKFEYNKVCPLFADQKTVVSGNTIKGSRGPCKVCEKVCPVYKDEPSECTVIDLTTCLGDLSTPKK